MIDEREHRIDFRVQQVKNHAADHETKWDRERSLKRWLGDLAPDERDEAERRLRDLRIPEPSDGILQFGSYPTRP